MQFDSSHYQVMHSKRTSGNRSGKFDVGCPFLLGENKKKHLIGSTKNI